MNSPEQKMIWQRQGIAALILVLAALQPAVHLWTRYAPPADTVPTGLHIIDSALLMYCMDMFDNGYYSGYATCQAPEGDASIKYYAVPHLWLYGVFGVMARAFQMDYFLFNGLANGMCALLFLVAAYHLIRRMIPANAEKAFVLFALSAGPGGVLYLITGWLGWHEHSQFDLYFYRFGINDLMEGPHLQPVLYFPRAYYTLVLACCFAVLAALIQAERTGRMRELFLWAAPWALCAFINARFAVFSSGLALLYLARTDITLSLRRRAPLLAAFALPAAVGCAASAALMRINPAVVGNHMAEGAMFMWFSPFIIAAWLHLLAAARPIWHSARQMPGIWRYAIGGLIGYLFAYGLCYGLYQVYWGNLLTGRDGSTAANISDWALLGVIPGMLVSLRRAHCAAPRDTDWVVLWFLAFTAVAMSGWGGGWFLRFCPQRIQVFLWLPLCVLVAAGLETWKPVLRRAAYALMLGCGVMAIFVAVFMFQGPLGRTGAQGPYKEQHCEIMRLADAALMRQIGEGTVMAPKPASDIIVWTQGNPVVFGTGSFNLTTLPYSEVSGAAARFFSPAVDDTERHDLARHWCVDYVYCPDTWPVAPATLSALRAASWLEEHASEGGAVLFRVRQESMGQ